MTWSAGLWPPGLLLHTPGINIARLMREVFLEQKFFCLEQVFGYPTTIALGHVVVLRA